MTTTKKKNDTPSFYVESFSTVSSIKDNMYSDNKIIYCLW